MVYIIAFTYTVKRTGWGGLGAQPIFYVGGGWAQPNGVQLECFGQSKRIVAGFC